MFLVLRVQKTGNLFKPAIRKSDVDLCLMQGNQFDIQIFWSMCQAIDRKIEINTGTINSFPSIQSHEAQKQLHFSPDKWNALIYLFSFYFFRSFDGNPWACCRIFLHQKKTYDSKWNLNRKHEMRHRGVALLANKGVFGNLIQKKKTQTFRVHLLHFNRNNCNM